MLAYSPIFRYLCHHHFYSASQFGMKINIIRQPFVQGFVILIAFAIAIAYARVGQVGVAVNSLPLFCGMQSGSIDAYLRYFECAYPIVSSVLVAILVILTGVSVAQISSRYALYTTNSSLPMTIFAALLALVVPAEGALLSVVVVLLMILSLKNYSRSFRFGYEFDKIFRASLYLGAIPLCLPSAVPVVLLLPISMLLFRRTLREAFVGSCGALLPILLMCYFSWGAGGEFVAPLRYIWGGFTDVAWSLKGLSMALIIASVAMCGCGIIASITLLMNTFWVGTKSRYINILNICALLLCCVALCLPSATHINLVILTPIIALLLPIVLVRMSHWLALLLYVVILSVGLFFLFVQ